MKQKVLFLCIRNTGRRPMVEAFLHAAGPELFAAQSAGLESGQPGFIN